GGQQQVLGDRHGSVPPRQDDGADEGGEQEHGDHLEADDVGAEDRVGDGAGLGGLAEVELVAPELVGQQVGQHAEDQQRDQAGQDALVVVELAGLPHRRPGQHDAEQEQHQHGPDVDQHLDDAEELGLEEDVLGGHAGQHDDQSQGGVDDVLHRHDADGGHAHDDGDDAEGDVLGGGARRQGQTHFFPLTSAPTSSDSGGLTVCIHSPSF